MLQIINQTDEEKMKMYMKLSKKELANMLIERDKHIIEPYQPQPNWYDIWSSDSGTSTANLTNIDNCTTDRTIIDENVAFTWTN